MSKLFVCYSVPLMKFLTSGGLRYEIVGLHPETKKQFWIFERSEKLNRQLNIWKDNNPNQ